MTADTPTPRTDAIGAGTFDPNRSYYAEMRVLAVELERELARAEAALAESTLDAERYRFLRDEEYPEPLLLMLRVAGIHKSEVDAAIDAAIKREQETRGTE